jgi:hypothetical protein
VGGQAITEFALVAPIFLFVMMSIFELGRAVYYTQILDSALRDAGRYAIVHGAEAIGCPSGPLPVKGSVPNSCDPDGSVHVIPTVKQRAVGVLDVGSQFIVHVKWCDQTAIAAGTSLCGNTLPCAEWAGVGDAYPLGDGDNGRGQLVTLCVRYSYASLFKSFLPIPDFTVRARVNYVVNH